MKTDDRKWTFKKWDVSAGKWSDEAVTVEKTVNVPESIDEAILNDGTKVAYRRYLRGHDIEIREDNRPPECVKPGAQTAEVKTFKALDKELQRAVIDFTSGKISTEEYGKIVEKHKK
jgi:hypothetical protein